VLARFLAHALAVVAAVVHAFIPAELPQLVVDVRLRACGATAGQPSRGVPALAHAHAATRGLKVEAAGFRPPSGQVHSRYTTAARWM
jgi:hypothetical protein